MGNDRRYLVLSELFLPTKGGTAVWFAEVYRRLGGKGIHILTADVPGARAVDAVHPNRIHRLGLQRVPWLRPESLGMYLKFFVRSLTLALSNRFEAVHACRALPEGLVGWAVARLTLRPVVIYAHGEELTGWGRGAKYRAMCFALRRADRVIANSGFTREELVRMGVSPERIVLIHPGVDVARFRPGLVTADLRAGLGLSEGQRLLLSVGRLQRRKGFDRVIQALPALRERGLDVHYALAGIGEDEGYLRDLARAAGVTDRVHLLGHVSPEDLPRWYNACDLFVMPNRDVGGDTEGFGMVFVEAAACGKPSVAGRAGGTASAVLDGETGLRVDGERPEQIVAALADLLLQPDRATAMGRAGLERVHRELSWEQVAEKTGRIDHS